LFYALCASRFIDSQADTVMIYAIVLGVKDCKILGNRSARCKTVFLVSEL
jgi:hypothetical protein